MAKSVALIPTAAAEVLVLSVKLRLLSRVGSARSKGRVAFGRADPNSALRSSTRLGRAISTSTSPTRVPSAKVRSTPFKIRSVSATSNVRLASPPSLVSIMLASCVLAAVWNVASSAPASGVTRPSISAFRFASIVPALKSSWPNAVWMDTSEICAATEFR